MITVYMKYKVNLVLRPFSDVPSFLCLTCHVQPLIWPMSIVLHLPDLFNQSISVD